jgi:hypothetical protein
MSTPSRLCPGAAIEPCREGQEHPLGANRLFMSTFPFPFPFPHYLVVLMVAFSQSWMMPLLSFPRT